MSIAIGVATVMTHLVKALRWVGGVRDTSEVSVSSPIIFGHQITARGIVNAPTVPGIHVANLHPRAIVLVALPKRFAEHTKTLLVHPAQRCIPRIGMIGDE